MHREAVRDGWTRTLWKDGRSAPCTWCRAAELAGCQYIICSTRQTQQEDIMMYTVFYGVFGLDTKPSVQAASTPVL